MDAEISNILRAPFADEYIGHRPLITCRACGDSATKVCGEHKKRIECAVCKAFITPAHTHLDYVGHADVTNRLTMADTDWRWEPVAFDGEGQPKYSLADDGMWVMWGRLTLGGVTRLGVGSCEQGTRDLCKQLVGDCIRNCAKWFGVALELWSKADRLENAPDEHETVQFRAEKERETPVAVDGETGEITRRSVAEDEPLPEYHGEDGDADWGESEFGGAAPSFAGSVAGWVADSMNMATDKSESHGATSISDTSATSSKPEALQGPSVRQREAIERLLAQMGIPTSEWIAYVSGIVGRGVADLTDLTRSEGLELINSMTMAAKGAA